MNNIEIYKGKVKRLFRKEEGKSDDGALALASANDQNVQPYQDSQSVFQASLADEVYRSLMRSFALVVLLPTFLFGFYFLLLAPERYVSESHFVVRNTKQKTLFEPAGMTANLVKSFTGGGVSNSMQDAYIIVDYVRSRSIVQDLQASIDLAEIYSRDKGDVFFSLESEPSLEEMWAYWNKRVSAYVDINSGIVQLRVEAFSPEEAKKISEMVIKSSEKLVNELSIRSRANALVLARREMEKSWQDYSSFETILRDFRDKTSVLDPAETAKSVSALLLDLQKQRAALETQISTLETGVKANSPALLQRRQQLQAVEAQIANLQGELTSEQNETALSAVLSEYEKIQIERMFKEKLFEIATKSFENARAEMDFQRLFVDVVVEPNLPESALYPTRGFNTFFVFMTAAIFWAIGALMMAAVRDHM